MNVRRWTVTGVALAVLWLFVRGVELAPTSLAEEFVIGLLVGMPIAFVFRRFYSRDVALSRIAAVPYTIVYVVLFLWELVTANVDVAYRVLAPSMPIEPDVVEVPLRVESDLAITTIANSITLTPGTLTMDYDDATNSLYVHALVAHNYDSVVDPIRRWEDYALRIFDEDANPGDPAPTPEQRKAAVATEAEADAAESEGESTDPPGESDGGEPGGDTNGE